MTKSMKESNTGAIVGNGHESMFAAIASGDSSSLAKLIDEGVDVDAINADRLSATMEAAIGGREDCLRLLVRAGADLDAASDGWTAAIFAAKFGSEGCLRMLASAGANLNLNNIREGWSAISIAARFDQAGCIRVLADGGADLNTVSVAGRTAAITAARFGNEKSLRALIELGADLTVVDKSGDTAADRAVEGGHTACAELIRAFELAREERAALASTTAGRASSPATRSRSRSL